MSRKDKRRRYRLTLEYDGTNFSGWQKQVDVRTGNQKNTWTPTDRPSWADCVKVMI